MAYSAAGTSSSDAASLHQRRRDQPSAALEVDAVRNALEGGETIVTTGLGLHELLQGFAGPRARRDLIDRFTALPLLSPDRQDHIAAAELR